MPDSTVELRGRVQVLLSAYGESGYKLAKRVVAEEHRLPESVRAVLGFFLEENWRNTQHPALIAAACRAVGENFKATEPVAASIVLLTGAADMHDDIIDKSKTKTHKPTTYGKFGQEAALLAGDALLFLGLMQFSKAVEEFNIEKRRKLRGLMEQAFLKIGNVAVNEGAFKGKWDVKPQEYLSVLEAKGSVAEACVQIGAVIGDGASSDVDALASVGKTLGLLMTVRNEFADLQYPQELKMRVKGETLPLPVLYALEDSKVKAKVLKLLKGRLTVDLARQVAEVVVGSEGVAGLKADMAVRARAAEVLLGRLHGDVEPFRLLLELAVTDI
jgi:geranylgeranyl pyrophosphate synthase